MAASENNSPNVLIIGAGPTGLTAAVELQRLGAQVTLAERRDGVSNLSRAVGIQTSSIDLLRPSGAGQKLHDEAVELRVAAVHNVARPIARMPFAKAFGPIFGLGQHRTEEILADTFSELGGKILWGTPATVVDQTEASVTALLGTETTDFDYVLAADGVRSTTREALGLEFPGFDLPDQWSIADVTMPTWHNPGVVSIFIGAETPVSIILPMSDDRFRVVSTTDDALAALPIQLPIETLHRTGSFTIGIRQLESYQSGRVFFASDAAHCHSPVGGRGMNLGMADGAEFAQRCITGTLDDYSASRHAMGQRTIAFSERGRKVMAAGGRTQRTVVAKTIELLGKIVGERD